MYIAVCDDQLEELNEILELLQLWQTENNTILRVRTFRSAVELVDAAQREHFTLYLLDVIMPGMDGLEAAREIRSFDTAADVVFLTSSPGFAYESYGVNALDYLLKPIRRNLLFPLLDRLMLREQRPQDGLTVKNGNSLFRIPFSQLTYVEINNRHLYFNLTNGQVREVPGRMRDYEKPLLARPEFTRIHRSYIINMFQIEELTPSSVRTFTGRLLPVSRLIYPQVQKEYMNLLFSEGEAGE